MPDPYDVDIFPHKIYTQVMCDLSLVVPCYNEEEATPIFYSEAKKIIAALKKSGAIKTFEFIFVDDGSKDRTLEIFRELSKKDKNVHYISFSRNFGKEAAIYAGLKKSSGKYVATLDVDLQDPPSLIPEMLECIKSEEYQCAATRRVNRKGEPPIRSFFARCFYKIMAMFTNIEVVSGARDFRVMTRKYVDSVLSICEKNRFSKGIFPWVGFKTKWFEYKNVERSAGTTKWSFWKLFLYSIDGILGFSTKPLALSSLLGIFSLFLSFIMIIFIIIRKIMFGDPVAGWPSLVCIILFLSGLQLFTIGILGQYLAKIYIEVKNRPIYIAQEEK